MSSLLYCIIINSRSFSMPDVSSLTEELKKIRELAPELVSSVEQKAPYASLLATQTEPTDRLVKSEEESFSTSMPSLHIRITAWNGNTFYSLVTSNPDKDNLFKMAKDLKGSISLDHNGYEIDPGDSLDKHFKNRCEIDPAQVPLIEKKDVCKHAYDILKEYDKRISPSIGYEHIRKHTIFANRSKLLSQTNNFLSFLIQVQAEEVIGGEQVRKTNYESFTGAGGHERTKLASDEKIQKIGEDVIKFLYAGQIKPGKYDVVLHPHLTGLLMHESFGHGCEYDAIVEGRAKSAEYIGKRVGSELVTIKDGGVENQFGSIYFSDDGVISEEPTVLVDKGILQPTMLTDLYTYTIMKNKVPDLKLTVNGRCQNPSRIICPRMTVTYLESLKKEDGGKSFDEMVSGIGDGYFIQGISSGMEDPLGWGLQVKALKATRIKSGRLTEEVFSPVDMTGYVPDVLGSISAVGTEIYFRAGLCGKGHKDYIQASLGGPYVKVRLTIGSI